MAAAVPASEEWRGETAQGLGVHGGGPEKLSLGDSRSSFTVSWTKTFHGGGERKRRHLWVCRRPATWPPGHHSCRSNLATLLLGFGHWQFLSAHLSFSRLSGQRGQKEMDTESVPGLASIHAEQVSSIPEANSRFPETTADSGAECRATSFPDPMATPPGFSMWGRGLPWEVHEGPGDCPRGLPGLPGPAPEWR